MVLRTGDRLGAYEIVGLLGHGAMGDVYRARDTRLGRDVAVKGLPAAFVNDASRLARLEREARLISQVNHPNICTLFDIVEREKAPFLILELIEGETLQQRLLRGPMPLREALRCASGIAAALEAAHSKGIIHRDLKPSNIKISSAGVKVLDFGVAKLARESGGDETDGPDPTVTLGGTKEGVLVGTVAYVSPEQAMGERVDARTDIWAFGCLLYEMLTAKRAFPGTAVADTLGAVMRDDPNWSVLSVDTPAELRKLLRRCLEKDRARRLANIADARLEIEDLLSGRSEPAQKPAAPKQNPRAESSRERRGRWIVPMAFAAGILFTILVVRVAFNRQAPAEPARVERAPSVFPSATAESTGSAQTAKSAEINGVPGRSAGQTSRGRNTAPAAASEPMPALINLPEGMRWARALDGGVPNTILALSPNGRLVVFSARDDDDVNTLWLRSLASNEIWQLPDTDKAISPFWSPDSASIGFFANQKLKRLDLNGLGSRSRDVGRLSAPVTLCDVRSQRGGTWGPDGTIVFAPFPGTLKQISANGGAVTSLTSLERGEPFHVRPQFLAGTRRLLYRVDAGNGRNNRYYVTSLDAPEKKLIATLESGNVTYSQGHLLFMQGNILMAQPFDVNAVATTGPPRPIADGVLRSTGSPPLFGLFSASQTGRLVYLRQGGDYNNPMVVRAALGTDSAGGM